MSFILQTFKGSPVDESFFKSKHNLHNCESEIASYVFHIFCRYVKHSVFNSSESNDKKNICIVDCTFVVPLCNGFRKKWFQWNKNLLSPWNGKYQRALNGIVTCFTYRLFNISSIQIKSSQLQQINQLTLQNSVKNSLNKNLIMKTI